MNPALPLTILWALMILCAWRLHRSAAIRTPIGPVSSIRWDRARRSIYDKLERRMRKARP